MLKQMQIEEHYPAALKTKIGAHNKRIAKLTELEAGIENRKRDLWERAQAGQIAGAQALDERRQIDADARTADIDAVPLAEERKSFVSAIKAAHTAEADRLALRVKERRTEIEKQCEGFAPALTQQAITSDGTFHALDVEARSCRQKSMTCHSDPELSSWLMDARQRIQAALR